MNNIQRLSIERECIRLVHRFCVLVDAYRHDELLELWTDDAEWGTWRGPLRGREAIRDYLDAKQKGDVGIHVAQNILIDVESEDEAAGSAVFSYYTGGSAPVLRVIGRYEDRFRRTADGWKFASRQTNIVFTGA